MRPPQQKPVIARRSRVAALLRRPGDGGVEVAHHLRVRRLADDLGVQISAMLVILARIALAGEQFGGDGAVADLGQPPADVLDVFMHAEDLGDDQHHRRLVLARRRRAVGDHLAVLHRHLDFAGEQARGVGLDNRLRHDRLHGQREAGAEAGDEEAAAVERLRRNQAFEFGIGGHGFLLGVAATSARCRTAPAE